MIAAVCQRWHARRDNYRPAGEVIDPRAFTVDAIERAPARAFVVGHHYSGSYPASRLDVGLFRGRDLVGVAVFSVPSSQASIPARTGGLAVTAGVELGRFVLLDEVPANAETWMLARAFDIVRAELGVRAVVSYSDPHRRVTLDGSVVMPGHVGTIYQAFNGRHVGRTKPRWIYLAPDGREIPPRSLSKLRNGERGDTYAYERLRALGAPARRPLEDARTYVARALAEGPFRRERHPGCLAYVWAFERRDRRRLPAALPYPKRDEGRASA